MPADELQAQLQQRGVLARAQSRNGMPYAMRLSLGVREANQAFITALEDILGANPALMSRASTSGQPLQTPAFSQ